MCTFFVSYAVNLMIKLTALIFGESTLPDFAMGQVFNRDNCRTPMQWEAGPNAGFTASGADPWLPVISESGELNVASQRRDPNSLWNTKQTLLRIREENSSLKWGSLRWLPEFERGEILGYERIYQSDSLASS
jgi:glycosidase